MEAAFPIEQNHFLFQFGGTAHFIPRRFKDRRRVVGGGGCGGSGGGGVQGEGTPLRSTALPNFAHTYTEGRHTAQSGSAPKETSANR